MKRLLAAAITLFVFSAASAQPAGAPAPAADDGRSAARQAAEERQTRNREEAARKRAEFEKLCIIKPVMTDDEIDVCRRVAYGRR
jgi:hypothetical protein